MIVKKFLQIRVSTRGTSVGCSIDRDESRHLNHERGSADGYRRVIKQWIPKSITQQIEQVLTKAQTVYRKETREWGDIGRVLPAAKFQDFVTSIKQLQDEVERLVDYHYDQNYETTKELARIAAGPDWDETKFPRRGELKGKYGIDLRYSPLTTPDTFALDCVEESVLESMRAEMESEQQQAYEGYVTGLVEDTLGILRDAKAKLLEGGERTRYGTLISRAKNQARLLREMNPTGDGRLEELAEKLTDLYSGLSSEVLRDSKGVRAKVAEQAASIIDPFNSEQDDEDGSYQILSESAPAPTEEVNAPETETEDDGEVDNDPFA